MRKFLVVLLLPAFIITSRVVSTEKTAPLLFTRNLLSN